MTGKRRRRKNSYWLDTLREIRHGQRARQNLQHRTASEQIPISSRSLTPPKAGQEIPPNAQPNNSDTPQISDLRDDSALNEDSAIPDSTTDVPSQSDDLGITAVPNNLSASIPDLDDADDHLYLLEPREGVASTTEVCSTYDVDVHANEPNGTLVETVCSPQDSGTGSQRTEHDHTNRASHSDGMETASILSFNSKLSSPCEPDLGMLNVRLRMWKSAQNLTAMIMLVGSVRFTVKHYEFIRDIIEDGGSGVTWPPYSRTLKYFKTLVHSIFPGNQVVRLRKKASTEEPNESYVIDESDDENLSPELDSTRNSDQSRPHEEVRVFLPSAWAKLDVSTSVVFHEMFPSFSDENYTSSPLDESEIIQNEKAFTDCCDHIFVEHDGSIVRALPGDIISVHAMDVAPHFADEYCIQKSEESYKIICFVTATWVVKAEFPNEAGDSPSFKASEEVTITGTDKSVMITLTSARTPSTLSGETNIDVTPGDICTLLKPEGESSLFSPVLVHRYWKNLDGLPSIVLLWIESDQDSDPKNSRDLCLTHIRCSHAVRRVKLREFGTGSHRGNIHGNLPKSKPPFGRLLNGTPFVVYRILLYCDDFQKSSQMSKAGSAGGCYFLPLSFPVERRRTTSSVRIVSLTPPGVSTNDMIHSIVPDLVHARTHGVSGHTPSGVKLRIFVDVVGFVADYPASAAAIDVLGHVASSPYTVCSFRRLKYSATEGSTVGYTTKVHSNNSSFLRHGERHDALRKSSLSDSDANRLGMVQNHRYGDKNCPLLYLQREIDSQKSSAALRNDSTPVITGSFDAYRNNVIAADHLLTGVSKDILNATFQTIPTAELRAEIDIRICAALRTNGFLPQKDVFITRTRTLHSMTLSQIFCVLTVAVPVVGSMIDRFSDEHNIYECFNLLQQLQTLVAYTYWWPEKDLDEFHSVNAVRGQKERYFSDLRKMSKRYVSTVDRVCRKCPEVRKQADKPNLHRLIELYEHTIPAFGHVRETMELVFESAHQPLKRAINRKKKDISHIFAVEQCVGNDWQGRLAALSRADLNANNEARRGMRRLLLGEEENLLDEVKHQEFTKHCDETLAKLFTPSLRKQFTKSGMVANFCASKDPQWKARTTVHVELVASNTHLVITLLKRILKLSKQFIRALFPHCPEGENQRDLAFHLFKYARRVKTTTFGTQVGKPYVHDTIQTNCAVVIHTDPTKSTEKIITSSPQDASTRPLFFVVVSILEREDETPWAICVKCTKRGKFLQRSSP